MPNHNLYALFARAFPTDPHRTVIVAEAGDRYSYADLEQQSARYARLLHKKGIKKGDRVAVQVDKSPQALFLYLACLRAGFIYLPLNTAYTQSEVGYFLGNAQPSALVCRPSAKEAFRAVAAEHGVGHILTLNARGGGTVVEHAAEVPAQFTTVACAAQDLAAILYTSGTTGTPKGAMITHGNLAANALTLTQAWGFTERDVLLHALPIFHVHGLFVACHCVLLSASQMILLNRFDAQRIVQLLPEATVFMGVPTFYTRLLAAPELSADVCQRMRLFVSGSAPLLEHTFTEFQRRTGHTILERYGMTETGMNTSNPLTGPRIAGTVGPPLPDVVARVVNNAGETLCAGEVGELQVKGPNVFTGYWDMPDKTAEEFTADGYFKTGDLARIDHRGYVAIVGRTKDMVISGGYNVYPKEIELLIDAIEGVAESAVIGIPHPDFGEGVTAVVVRRHDTGAPDEADILHSLKQNLAAYKVPKRVLFVSELPRNTMGKVQKNMLRDRFAEVYAGAQL